MVRVPLLFALSSVLLAPQGLPPSSYIPYTDAAPVLQALREDLLPVDLRGNTTGLEAGWPAWVTRRDAAIRARVDAGDADSIINFLQFGTTFTKQPRITEQQPAGVLVKQAGTGATVFLPSPLLRARIDDFVAAVASPRRDERVQFAREVIERARIDPATEAGRTRLRSYLEERTAVVGSAPHAATFSDPNADLSDVTTLFRDRGLASDTAIPVDFALEQALAAIRAAGLLAPGSVRRVGIIGPGLDFADKQEGYDFYPPQTIQPFAVIDSLLRLGLATPASVQVTAFDVSRRVLAHLEAARTRAAAGSAYAVVVPRNLDQPWTQELVRYWERFGDQVGETGKAPPPPSGAGRVDARSVAIRPPVVLSVVPRDLNIVLQRIDSPPPDQQFDLMIATNILIYYDVFEQSLAVANIARMLRPGGLLLSNDRIFELPGGPLRGVGVTTAVSMRGPGTADKGDRLEWFHKR